MVAAEVRTLAQRSAQAAREIKDLIGDSVAKVDSGHALVGDAGKQMQEIVAAVKHVAHIMSDISESTGEQSAGIEQVNGAVSQMENSTQHNAALVEKAAVAAAAMQHSAIALRETVAAFNVEG